MGGGGRGSCWLTEGYLIDAPTQLLQNLLQLLRGLSSHLCQLI